MGVITIPPIDRSSDLVPRRSGNRGDILIAQGIQPPVFTSPDKVVTPVVEEIVEPIINEVVSETVPAMIDGAIEEQVPPIVKSSVSKGINEDILPGENVTIDHESEEKITVNAVIPCPYDVGDIYHTINTRHPSDKWPDTTWEPFAEGRVITGVGNNGTTNYPEPNLIGGLDGVVITETQMPSHQHDNLNLVGSNINSFRSWTAATTAAGGTFGFGYGTHAGGNRGGNQPHENRMPFTTAYMWLRIA